MNASEPRGDRVTADSQQAEREAAAEAYCAYLVEAYRVTQTVARWTLDAEIEVGGTSFSLFAAGYAACAAGRAEAAQCPATLDAMRCESYAEHPEHMHFTEGSLEMMYADLKKQHERLEAPEEAQRATAAYAHAGGDSYFHGRGPIAGCEVPICREAYALVPPPVYHPINHEPNAQREDPYYQ